VIGNLKLPLTAAGATTARTTCANTIVTGSGTTTTTASAISLRTLRLREARELLAHGPQPVRLLSVLGRRAQQARRRLSVEVIQRSQSRRGEAERC
jgi:hypothetical protein